jgi:hypothetical protein
MPKFDCIERPLSNQFYRYGVYITKHPVPFIVFPILAMLAMSVGWLYLDDVIDPIYLFTPSNAPSKAERQIIHDLWPLVNGTYMPGRSVTQSREVQVSLICVNLLSSLFRSQFWQKTTAIYLKSLTPKQSIV